MRLLMILLDPSMLAMAALVAAIVWMMADQRDRFRPVLVIAVVINFMFGYLLDFFMGKEGSLLPFKYDHILYFLDRSMGLSAPHFAAHLQGPWRIPLMVVYRLMVPAMVTWLLVARRAGRHRELIVAYAAELVAGPMMYAIMPACGPVYAFRLGWIAPPPVDPVPIHLAGLPNAFPSLHMGTAMILVLMAPGRWSRLGATLFMAATGLAVISTGEHYLIDLIPGLAFGCFAALVGCGSYRRALDFLGIALAWSLSVRLMPFWLMAHAWLLITALALTAAAVLATLVQEWRCKPKAAVQELAQPA